MGRAADFGFRGARQTISRDSLPDPARVRPFGPFGVGLFTAHPVGLLVIAFVTVLVWRMPGGGGFIVGSVAMGAILGLSLFLQRRTKRFRDFRMWR